MFRVTSLDPPAHGPATKRSSVHETRAVTVTSSFTQIPPRPHCVPAVFDPYSPSTIVTPSLKQKIERHIQQNQYLEPPPDYPRRGRLRAEENVSFRFLPVELEAERKRGFTGYAYGILLLLLSGHSSIDGRVC